MDMEYHSLSNAAPSKYTRSPGFALAGGCINSIPASLPSLDVAYRALARQYGDLGLDERMARTHRTIAKLLTPRIFAGFKLHYGQRLRLLSY